MNRMIASLRAAVTLLLLCTLLLGAGYTLTVTALTQMLFPAKADGSLVERHGRVVGSTLLGQTFTQDKYFWSRPSATTPPYNAAASGGSNFNPSNPKLLQSVQSRIGALRRADPSNKAPVPVDLVTASGSGLDPHISVIAAEYQVPRVARARGIKESELRTLLIEYTEPPDLGVIGPPRVNVLKLNLALDEQ